MYIQINSYADFKAVAATATGKVFYFGTPGSGNPLHVWFVASSGSLIISNSPPGVLAGGSQIGTVVDPGTFTTDFPTAVALSQAFLGTTA